MRREQARTVDGKTIEVLVPETQADIEELHRRQQQGEEFDDRFSFGDYYEQPPRRRRRRAPHPLSAPNGHESQRQKEREPHTGAE